jgi:hypothetical protein
MKKFLTHSFALQIETKLRLRRRCGGHSPGFVCAAGAKPQLRLCRRGKAPASLVPCLLRAAEAKPRRGGATRRSRAPSAKASPWWCGGEKYFVFYQMNKTPFKKVFFFSKFIKIFFI